MKRIKTTMLVPDTIDKEQFQAHCKTSGWELEAYEERKIPKEPDVLADHSMDSLMDGALDIANGAWRIIKGLAQVGKWAIIIIIVGVRWLWKEGAGKKKEQQQTAVKK